MIFKHVNVANSALRTVDFKGGLDKFLKTAKNSILSKKVKKIKALFLQNYKMNLFYKLSFDGNDSFSLKLFSKFPVFFLV